jgi:hypothetical protein
MYKADLIVRFHLVLKSKTTAPITFTPTVTNVSCFGGNNGKSRNCSYWWYRSNYLFNLTKSIFLIPVFFDNLSAGTYQIVIQDEAGCFIPYEVTIVEPILYGNLVPNSIPEICDGDMDGAFTVEILGGTAPYQVSLDNPWYLYSRSCWSNRV